MPLSIAVPVSRVAWLLGLLGILVLAAALRLPALDRIPPGFQFDEAYNAIDAWRVAQGSRDMFFPANGGREPLLSYIQALFLATLGPSLGTLRLTSAIISLVTLALVALVTRRLFAARPDAAWVGLLTAGVLAVTYWHLHFSRYSIRAILVPLFMTLVVWAFDVGAGPRAPRVLPLFVAGAALAGSVYAHPTGRLLPFVLVGYAVWLAWADRPRAWGTLLSLALTGAVSFALFLPLGFYFLDHQWLFFGHPSDVSILDQNVRSGSVWAALLDHALAVLGMVFVRGDRSHLHNLPFRPVYDPLLSFFFVVGLALMVWAAWRARGRERGPYILLAVWAVVAVFPTLLSDAAPNYSRAIGVLPVLSIITAAGLSALSGWLLGRGLKTAAYIAPLVVLAVAGVWTARDYFVVWAAQPELYYSYDADKEDVARLVQDYGARGTVYLTPLWATQATISFLTRNNPPEAVEMERGMVLPLAGGRDAYYVFPAEQERRARRVGFWLGEAAQQQTIPGRLGHPLLLVYTLPGANRPTIDASGKVGWTAPRPAEDRDERFVAAPRLLGVTPDEKTQAGAGDRLRWTLFWHAPTPAPDSLTLFAHLVDSNGMTRLQDDHLPLGGSYPTSRWGAAEVVVEDVQFNLPRGLPAGDYRVQVGWYDAATGARRPLMTGGDAVTVGRVTVVAEGR